MIRNGYGGLKAFPYRRQPEKNMASSTGQKLKNAAVAVGRIPGAAYQLVKDNKWKTGRGLTVGALVMTLYLVGNNRGPTRSAVLLPWPRRWMAFDSR